MTFDEWFNEVENYATRGDRLEILSFSEAMRAALKQAVNQ